MKLLSQELDEKTKLELETKTRELEGRERELLDAMHRISAVEEGTCTVYITQVYKVSFCICIQYAELHETKLSHLVEVNTAHWPG